MRMFGYFGIAAVIAIIDASMRPWLPLAHSISLIAILATVIVMTDHAHGYADVWASLVAALLTDVLLGAPLAVRSTVLLAAFVVVRPFVRTFRQQHGLRSLLAIGIILTAADRLGVVLGHRSETWAVLGGTEMLVWASALAWTVIIILLLSRTLRRRTLVHAVTSV